MATREFDLIVWGATGFTGELVVEYLVAQYGVGESARSGLRWAIAGRNEAKLKAVRDRWVAPEERDQLPLIIADSSDADSLASMVRSTRVICTTVGPYAKYGTPLVAACVEAGTHYCDLTGEVQWMARVIPEYHAAAVASGARIVHCCGFDSVPFDMGVWYAQQVMHERHGVYADRVKGRVRSTKGGASGGTIASMLNMMEEAGRDPSIRRQVGNPYVLYPSGVAPGLDGGDQRGALYDEDFQQWTSPFIMAAINTRVVRRSNALLGFPWGKDFRYDESLLNRSAAQARLAVAAGGAGMLTLAMGPTRQLAQRFLPKPGEGPSREARAAGSYVIEFLAMDSEDRSRDTRVRVTGDMDPGYGSTSKMLAEAAVCLAQDNAAVGGGFWTPASGLSQPYLDRLQKNAGVAFQPI